MTSTSRIPPEAGYVEPSRLPRGPRGNPLCRKCGAETPGRRNTFCSDACVHEWKLRTQPAYQARHVLERDAGVCASCGIDCVALLAELKALRSEHRRERGLVKTRWQIEEAPTYSWELAVTAGRFGARCEELELPTSLRFLTRRLWEMDHVVPVVEGGGSCGLENLRTLCWACHRQATRELRARQAAKRRANSEAGGG